MAVAGFAAGVRQHQSGRGGFLEHGQIGAEVGAKPGESCMYVGYTDAYLLNSGNEHYCQVF